MTRRLRASPSGPCLPARSGTPSGHSCRTTAAVLTHLPGSSRVLPQPRADACVETGGGRWIRTTEGVSQQIYSLPPLAAWVSLRIVAQTRETARYFEGVRVPCQRASRAFPAAPVGRLGTGAEGRYPPHPFPVRPGAAQRAFGRPAQSVSRLRREGFQTLNRKCRTSPSCTRYSLPSRRSRPASRAPDSPRYLMKSS